MHFVLFNANISKVEAKIIASIENKEFLRINQFAEAVGVHPETVRRSVRRGAIKAVRLGDRGNYLIPISELQRLCDPGSVLLMPPEEP